MFNFFNKNNTRIAGSMFKPFRKTTEEIKLERINLDKQIYGSKMDSSSSEEMNDKKLLEAKKDLNRSGFMH